MVACTTFACVLLLLATVASCDDLTYVIVVAPDNATAVDGGSCHPPPDGGGKSPVPCRTLDYAFQLLEDHKPALPVKLYLASPNSTYDLGITQNVTNWHDISLYGNMDMYPLAPTVKCNSSVGLSFINSYDITISNIHFIECGALHVSTSKNYSNTSPDSMSFLNIRYGLYFYNCTNVRMTDVHVLNSTEATGVVMYDTDGVVEVKSSTFAYNSVRADGSQAGGGGFAVEFTYCKPGDVTCNKTKYDPTYKRNRNAVYLFENCTFEGNEAHNLKSNNLYIIPAKSEHIAAGRGGGLGIFLKGDAVNNSIQVVGSRFINNGAVWGGGLRILMSDNVFNDSVSVSDCDFVNNRAFITKNGRYTAGGGMHVIIATQNWNDIFHNKSKSKVHISDSRLNFNEALEGGALTFIFAHQGRLIGFDKVTEISVSNSTFEGNQPRLASAVLVVDFPVFNEGLLPSVEFYDCNFSSNHLMSMYVPIHAAGLATVFIGSINTSFINNVVFFNNTGSALVIAGTQVSFAGTTALFKSNNGTDGGAIALFGISSILIGPKSHMTFVDNYASLYGGAIYNRYVSDEFLESNSNCFLRYSEPYVDPTAWDVQFNFSGNMAGIHGCSILSTSIYPCMEGKISDIDKVFRWNDSHWHYAENEDCKNEIYTRPNNFTLEDKSLSDSVAVVFTPGHEIRLPLRAWDELGHEVTDNTVYSASVLDGAGVADVDPAYNYITSNYIRLTGEPGNNITLLLQTAGARTVHVEVSMKALNCPPGFVRKIDNNFEGSSEYSNGSVNKISCECPRDDEKYRNLLRCFSKEFASKIHVNYWYGPVNVDDVPVTYLMGIAPLTYRFASSNMDDILDGNSVRLPNSTDQLNDRLCGGGNRQGVLCGECRDGYAVAVNSPTYQCVPCSINSTTAGEFVKNLFAYVALTYLPIIIIFFVIIFFNVKLASSAAAGFLLYAQTVSSGYFDITGYSVIGANTSAPKVVQSIYSTVYGVFNLESFAIFLSPFCLNEQFTTLHVLCLDYFIAVFPLVVIAAVFLAYRCKSIKCPCPLLSSRRQQLTIDHEPSSATSLLSLASPERSRQRHKVPKNTLIHALMAFMLLSYTKFSLASIRTVVIDELFDSSGRTTMHRIYLAGNLSFGDRGYLLPFGILAILVIIFIVFLPPLLLLGPLQFIDRLTDKPRLGCLRRCWPSITIHTFLDTFQGYKPNRRFFAGLYLLFRLFMFLTYSFSQDLHTQYVFQQILILFFAILVSLLRPYTKELFNYVDTLLFLNLGILNALSLYTSEHSYNAQIYGFECFLVFLPLAYIICYVIWNKVHKRKQYQLIKHAIRHRLVNLVGADTPQPQERERLVPFDESVDINYSSDDPDEQIFQRAARGNHFHAANIHSVPPRRPGEVPQSVVSIPDPQLPKIEEGEEEKRESDSGISTRQTNSGQLDFDDKESL